jgi:hypothetical protein
MSQELPKHVQKQLDDANALEAHVNAQLAEQAAPAQSVAELVAPLPTEPQTPTVAAPPPPAPQGEKKDDFEHKYRVLQGMYEADVKQVKAGQRQLQAELAALKTARETPPPQETRQPDPKDVETFGADLIEMVKRYAEAQQAEVNRRLAVLEQTVGMVRQQATATSADQFFTKLRTLVPDFDAVNADERWLIWLGQVDPMFGVPRQAAVDDAQAKGDVGRLANLFAAFKATLPRAPEPDETLLQQVTPQSSGRSQEPARVQVKRTITEKAINSFFRDVQQGKYLGREAEAAAAETEINLAVAEGRVVN